MTALADRVAWLVALEEIKQLKARYFRFVDETNLDGLGELFTDDMRLETPFGVYEGRDAIIAWMRERRAAAGTWVSVHHGHMPEIDITSETTATGIWAMFDYVEHAGADARRFQGYGHYREHYRKEGGRWRIASTRLTRIRVDDLGADVAEA